MAAKKLPDQDVLRQLLDCDPEAGLLFWKWRPVSMFEDDYQRAETRQKIWNGRFAGQPAFIRVHGNGYLAGQMLGQSYLTHRRHHRPHQPHSDRQPYLQPTFDRMVGEPA